jgi:TadE-like protein
VDPSRPAREVIAVLREDGQATVETVALLPLLVLLLGVAWQLALAGDAGAAAAGAARAAARAVAAGTDPEAAARAHLPERLERGLRVRAGAAGAVRVSVRVPGVVAGLRLGRVGAEADLGAVR